MRERLRRVLWALRHPVWVFGPRCDAEPFWRLIDAGRCICPRGHEHHGGPSPEWHADGTGYIWTDGAWAWRGPMVSLDEMLRDDPDRDTWGDFATFYEDPNPSPPGIDLSQPMAPPLPVCPDHDRVDP